MKTSRTLTAGVIVLTLAVFAGVAETMVTLAGFQLAGQLPSGWQVQVGIRGLIYGGLLVLLGLTWRGSRAARWAVLILLGVVGSGSLLVPLISALASGSGLLVALDADTSPWVAVVRVAHILLVLTGSVILLAHRPAPAPAVAEKKKLITT